VALEGRALICSLRPQDLAPERWVALARKLGMEPLAPSSSLNAGASDNTVVVLMGSRSPF